MNLFDALKQYLSDAAPGGDLNSELSQDNLLRLAKELGPVVGKGLTRAAALGTTVGSAEAGAQASRDLGLFRTAPPVQNILNMLAEQRLYERASEAADLDTPELGPVGNLFVELLGGGLVPAAGVGAARLGREISRAAPLVPSRAGKIGGNEIGAVGKNVKRKPRAIGSLFDAIDDPQEALRMAKRREHIKRTNDGVLIGAPASVNSPQSLGAMRSDYDMLVDAGLYNANWYDRARRAGSEQTGYTFGMPATSEEYKLANLFARGNAAYSPQADPVSNLNFFLKQHNPKVLLAQDVPGRTGSQLRNVRNAYIDDPVTGGFSIDADKIRLSRKTGPYSESINPTVDMDLRYNAANDIWQGRAYGYTNTDGSRFSRGFTPQEHGFLTGENLLASDRATRRGSFAPPIDVGGEALPMTPHRAQAATWAAERFNQYKASAEAAIAKAQKKLARWEKSNPSKRGPKPSVPKMPTDDELRARAMAGVDTGIPKHTFHATDEYVTRAATGHLPGLVDAPDDVRSAFTAMHAANESTRGGRDTILDAWQMFQRPRQSLLGEYLNSMGVIERNPMVNSRPLVEFKRTPTGPQLGDASRKGLEARARIKSLVDAQEYNAGGVFIPETGSMKASQKNAALLSGDPASVEAIADAARKAGFDVSVNGNGLHITSFYSDDLGRAPKSPEDILKFVKAQAKHHPVSVKRGMLDTVYEGAGWTAKDYKPGSGALTQSLLDYMQDSGIHNWAQRLDAAGYGAQVGRKNAIDASFGNLGGANPYLARLREHIGEHGWQNLLDYVKKNGAAGFPAVVGLPVGGSLLGEDSLTGR